MFAVAGAAGDFTDSPYVYNLAWFTPGKAYTGAHHVRDNKLATVRTENLSQGKGSLGVKGAIASSDQLPIAMFPGTALLPISLPATRDELFTTEGVTWTGLFFQLGASQDPEQADARQQASLRTYQAGRRSTERWNGAVFGPSLPGRAGDVQWAHQVADRSMVFQVPLFGSTPDTAGRSKVDEAHSSVQHDGRNVCESDDVVCRIPGAQPHGRYRVTTEAARSLADTSTKVSVVWDVNYDGTPALPVQVVRFAPVLDATNSAPGDRLFKMPVTVQRNPGSNAADVASLTVAVSYDDGAHWQQAPFVDGQVLLHRPANGYVSLRARATDTTGNTVEQIITRAYRLR